MIAAFDAIAYSLPTGPVVICIQRHEPEMLWLRDQLIAGSAGTLVAIGFSVVFMEVFERLLFATDGADLCTHRCLLFTVRIRRLLKHQAITLSLNRVVCAQRTIHVWRP